MTQRALSVVFALLVGTALLLVGTTRASAMACSVSSFPGAYGSIDVTAGTAIDTTAAFSVTCSGGSANQAIRFCMNIGSGSTSTGPSGERVMRSSGDYLDFEFYADVSHTQLWGSWGIGSSSAYPSGSPAGLQQDVTLDGSGQGTFNFTAYARILAGQQNTLPGSFSWSGSEPTVQYVAKSGASSCPTSGGSSGGSSSTLTATVPSSCSVSVGSINFGSSTTTVSANVDATGTVTALCSNGTAYSIGLNNGANASGNQNRMRLGATTNYLNYELYTNSGRTTAWATTTSSSSCTGGTSTCSLGTGSGSNQSVTIYGRVPAQTAPAAGSYSDSVVVTVTY